jgi:hypothetical protein
MATQTYTLTASDIRRHMVSAWDYACFLVKAGKRVRVTVGEVKSKRTTEQNAALHALCHEVAQQRVWAGKHLDVEAWKRLFLDAWARATQRRQVEIVPSLDGSSIVQLGIPSRSLSVEDMSELLEFIHSWCAENGVEVHS